MTTQRKIIIGVLLTVTLLLAGISVYVGLGLRDEGDSDVPVASGTCAPIAFTDSPSCSNVNCSLYDDTESYICTGAGGGTCCTWIEDNQPNACPEGYSEGIEKNRCETGNFCGEGFEGDFTGDNNGDGIGCCKCNPKTGGDDNGGGDDDTGGNFLCPDDNTTPVTGCFVFLCPNGCGADNQCAGGDPGATVTFDPNCTPTTGPTLDGRCGQIDYVKNGTDVSTGQYCGIKAITCGTEACDESGTTTTAVEQQCTDLSIGGVTSVQPGENNTLDITFQYQIERSDTQFQNIRAVVYEQGTTNIIGRSNNTPTVSAVEPYSFVDNGNIETYKFLWEAVNTDGTNVAEGNYDVRVLLDGVSPITTPTNCLKSVQITSTAVQEPVFTIVKNDLNVCTAEDDQRIDYSVTVTNNGAVEGTLLQVTDTIDSQLTSLGIAPTNITPSYGTYANGVITWVGTAADRTYAPSEAKTFSYRITIPNANLSTFVNSGVENTAQYDEDDGDEPGDSATIEINTPIVCAEGVKGVIPETGIFDDGSGFILLAMFFVTAGLVVYKLEIGKGLILATTNAVYMKSPFVRYEDKMLRKNKK